MDEQNFLNERDEVLSLGLDMPDDLIVARARARGGMLAQALSKIEADLGVWDAQQGYPHT
ncbi:MAG TPA: hypothetical protein VGH96_01565 [Streptosporangiaceae bacterium]|jgi:hypothetical protein